MRQKLNILGLTATASLIIYGSITSGRPITRGGLPLHFIAYFVLATAFLVVFHDTEKGHIEAVIASSALALTLELIQWNLPYRTFSITDFITSALGASTVILDCRIGLISELVKLEDKMIETILE